MKGSRRGALHLTALAWLACLSGCGEDAYALVSILSYSGNIADVTRVIAHVTSATGQQALTYPRKEGPPLAFDTLHPVTFSVEFPASYVGETTIEVELVDEDGQPKGYGRATTEIVREHIVRVEIRVVPGAVRPEHPSTPDGGDPSMLCDPYAPAAACGMERACGVLCTQDAPAASMCYLAGTGAPGAPCANNGDCLPGSQCFAFSALGCAVKACLRFCDHDDNQCGEQGSYCNLPIACGSSTPFAACSRPCDPTGDATVGCAPGLGCFVFAGETTDCACPGQGDTGSPCTQNSGCDSAASCLGCQAGLSCIVPAGAPSGATGACRPVCDLATPRCPSGTTCRAFEGSTRRLFGFCQ
jgi:hypothetical protein